MTDEPKKLEENVLLPCPFCGGQAKHCWDFTDSPIDDHCIECQTCHNRTSNADTYEEARQAWNHRLEDKP